MVHLDAFAIAAVALFAFPANCDLYPKSSAVLSVDNKSYDRLIAQSNYTSVVEFYAPWCGHCKNLQPIYENAAKKLKGVVKVAAINCDRESNKPLCARFGVQGFPTLNIISPGKTLGKPIVEEYNGPRTVKGIYDTVVEKIPNYVKLLKDETIEEWTQDSAETPKAILFTDKSKVSPLYKALAIDFKGSIQFGQLQTALDGRTLNKVYDIKKLPKLLLIKNSEKIYHDGEMKKENLLEFLSQVTPPNPDPAPLEMKPSQSDKGKKETKTKQSATHSEPSKPKDQQPIVSPILATPLPSLSNEAESINRCLSSKTGTCVLALTSSIQDKSTEVLIDSLSMLVSKYNKQKRVIFPVYSLPESNPKYAELRKALSLGGEVNIIAINGKRRWWRELPKFEFSGHTTLESALEGWISEIQLGEGEKKRLPDDLIIEGTEQDSDEKIDQSASEVDVDPENYKPIENIKSEGAVPEEAKSPEKPTEIEDEIISTDEDKLDETQEPVNLQVETPSETHSVEFDTEKSEAEDTKSEAKSTANANPGTESEDHHDEL